MKLSELNIANEINLLLKEKILFITINREEKMNSLNRSMVFNFIKIIDFLYQDDDILGAIVTGSGKKSFISGGDIKEFASLPHETLMELIEKGQKLTSKIENCPKPVIAAINGFAFGGGCEIAMACHLRVASENAFIGLPEVKLGMIPGYGGTQRITKLVGRSKALEIMLTGRSIPANEALTLGLINKLVAGDDLIKVTQELMNEILANSPLSISGIIKAVNACEYSTNGFEIEKNEYGKCASSNDFIEGTSAFKERRKPLFKGK